MPKISSFAELESRRKDLLSIRDPGKISIAVCGGHGCDCLGNQKIFDAFKEEVEKSKLASLIDVRKTGCQGFCEQGPVVIISPEEIFYTKVALEDIAEIIATSINGKVIERLLYADPDTGEKGYHENEIPFYKNQLRLLIGENKKIDPKDIEDYLAVGGYSAQGNVLKNMSPEEVVSEVKKSNLRGRSGSGFPVGRKWEACRKTKGDVKYIICNCHEGDPGAFVDRRMLEGNPHKILEGMVIGGYAIQAKEGFIFLGEEFPQTVKNAETAIRQAQEYGLLGKNILGSGFDFTVKISLDAGNYVCGESTALMASMTGNVGEPITKYYHATDKGLWAKPTVLNNLQTWANIPLIFNRGADWFSKIGTGNSTGTRVFSLSGSIKNSGVVEAVMGTPLKELVYTIGGGIKGNKKFKAVLVGGPMGGFVPEDLLDLKIDFDELYAADLALGPGLIVIDENTCIVELVKYLLTFLSNESCGKCLPCREGLRQMIKIMNRITEGQGKQTDFDLLESISGAQKSSALCALGKGAANTLLGSIKHFRNEYESHILEKRCPAGVCKMSVN